MTLHPHKSSSKKHSNLEFHIGRVGTTETIAIETDFNMALAIACREALSFGDPVAIDVITMDRSAARKWGGDDAVESYLEDPDASVHQRIVITATDQGRIA